MIVYDVGALDCAVALAEAEAGPKGSSMSALLLLMLLLLLVILKGCHAHVATCCVIDGGVV